MCVCLFSGDVIKSCEIWNWCQISIMWRHLMLYIVTCTLYHLNFAAFYDVIWKYTYKRVRFKQFLPIFLLQIPLTVWHLLWSFFRKFCTILRFSFHILCTSFCSLLVLFAFTNLFRKCYMQDQICVKFEVNLVSWDSHNFLKHGAQFNSFSEKLCKIIDPKRHQICFH